MTFEVQRSALVFQGRVFAVRRDWVRLPNGQETALDILQHGGAVTIVPLDEHGHLWFVRQYRHAARAHLLEFPAGTLEPDEAPETCAARELREEIGLAARRWTPLGTFFLAPGYSTEFMHLFLAEDLYPAPLAQDEDEVLEPLHLPVAEAYRRAWAGEIQDGKTLAALLLAWPHLRGFLA
ncbi:MAG TPA: NUDIX hydrolase [Anaerolineales bacterium]|nr:NUDIX hydrolase [Anaerolineales bacterium]